MRHVVRLVELLGDTQITDFYHVFFAEEDVHGLDVTMQDLERMQIVQAEAHFDEELPDALFFERLATLTLHVLLQVTTLAKLHDDVD